MTKQEYLDFHAKACATMTTITRMKNADYTGAGDDPFANFSRVEALGICSTEQGFLTRMTDKLSRLASFATTGSLLVKDESVTDTLMDLANYCILMAAFIESKKRTKLKHFSDDYAFEHVAPGAVEFYSTSDKAAHSRAP